MKFPTDFPKDERKVRADEWRLAGYQVCACLSCVCVHNGFRDNGSLVARYDLSKEKPVMELKHLNLDVS